MNTPGAYAIKAPLGKGETLAFAGQRTMYGGKHIAAGDRIFLFGPGLAGLVGRGVVATAALAPRDPDVPRQVPLVSLRVTQIEPARRPLPRSAFVAFRDWKDGRPETEINFKYYRQATEKIVGLSPETAAFLDACF